MDYRTKSLMTIAVLLLIMASVGVFINNLDGDITGAVVTKNCKCSSDADCDDRDSSTKDICLYPETCEASLCVHNK